MILGRLRRGRARAADTEHADPPDPLSSGTRVPGDNRPRALRNAPIALLEDPLNQMSFGERAALEGILSQLQPQVSVELGTCQGGSLGRIAQHSSHVHTFDIENFAPDRTGLANVEFHLGDSKRELPQLLQRCVDDGTAIEFALVDGDHTAEGVRADLSNLLSSPACARTVIVAHDTMNPVVRGGIESLDLANQPRVVYAELDFVAGFQFVGGSFAGELWGGLGLIVTGDRDRDGYGAQPLQDRFRGVPDLIAAPPAPGDGTFETASRPGAAQNGR